MKQNQHPYRPLAEIMAAWLLLSVLLNYTYPAEHYFSWQLLRLSFDVWFLFLPLAVAAACGRQIVFWSPLPTWALFLLLRLFRLGETAVPAYLNRPLNLYIDSGYLFGFYDLLKTTAQKGDLLMLMAKAAAIVAGLIVSSWYAFQLAAKNFLHRKIRRAFLLFSCILLGGYIFLGLEVIQPTVTVSFGRALFSIWHQLETQKRFYDKLEEIAGQRAAPPSLLQGLDGADVLLFVVESYGRTVFSRPEYFQTMQASLVKFADRLERHGFLAASSYLESPTFGGASWLAHSTLEFGVRSENDIENTALLRSHLLTMAAYFGKNGYHTVSVMPGTRFAYPEGKAFGYQQYYYAWDFNYSGISFGWAPMPDQFVLDWIRHKEIIDRHQPLFIRYILISSHAAFNLQPQFIADWDSIGNGSIYSRLEPVRYPIYWPDLHNATQAYLRSLDYVFTTLGDYLAKYVSGNTLIIIMGDHQPNLQLTGEEPSWSVPVHIITRNPKLLAPFKRRGFTSGLIPGQPPPHAGMETFLTNFLEDFSSSLPQPDLIK